MYVPRRCVVGGRMRGGTEGSGWRMCDKIWEIRFTPAESPTSWRFDGWTPCLRRYEIAAVVCCSWIGNATAGMRAMISNLSQEGTG